MQSDISLKTEFDDGTSLEIMLKMFNLDIDLAKTMKVVTVESLSI